MLDPYWQGDGITLYHGDCLEIADIWNGGDVLVTDPPYGLDWVQPERTARGHESRAHDGIANDSDTSVRDAVLALWGKRRAAAVFGNAIRPPAQARKALVWQKPHDRGMFGRMGPWRADHELIYLSGAWPQSDELRSGILRHGRAGGLEMKATHHPHTKPVPLMRELIDASPPGVIVDTFAGSGTTLLAARDAGRHAIGVEIDEGYCETIARRLAQSILFSDA